MQTLFRVLSMLLPITVFLELWLIFQWHSAGSGPENPYDWREGFINAATVWALLAYAFTELLSLASALTPLCIGVCWASVAVATLFFLKHSAFPLKRRSFQTEKFSFIEYVLSIWGGIVLLATAVTGLIFPPNNWDSMTYHMSRVAHWLSNGTVAFYPTNILRQLYSGPLAEYAIFQFYALGHGSDYLADMVQWYCFAGCAIAMSLLAKRLQLNRFTQILTAFVVLTTPMLILQASTTQNDLVSAFFTCTTLLFLYSDAKVRAGISLGLAVLTKASAGLFAAPFIALAVLREFFIRRNWRKAATNVLVIGFLTLLLNVPQWSRNWKTFHNPLGYTPVVRLITSQTYAPGPLLSNIMRNVALELVTPLPYFNSHEERAIRRFDAYLNVNPDDPRDTWRRTGRFLLPATAIWGRFNSEDTAPNPLQTFLLILATVALLEIPDLRRSEITLFALCLWTGFVIFCWRLSWQPYNTRLHVPFLALASLPIAAFLADLKRHYHRRPGPLIVALMCISTIPIVQATSHPWFQSKNALLSLFALCLWAGFALFCWRIFWRRLHSRLHVPLPALVSRRFSAFFGEFDRRFRRHLGPLIFALVGISAVAIVQDTGHPRVRFTDTSISITSTRSKKYFVNRPELADCYIHAAKILSNTSCHDVGLESGYNDWEYPLWALEELNGSPIRIRHVNVDNQSRALDPSPGSKPCATISIKDPNYIDLYNRDGQSNRIACRP